MAEEQGYQNALDAIEDDISYHEDQLDRLVKARDLLTDEEEADTRDNSRFRGRSRNVDEGGSSRGRSTSRGRSMQGGGRSIGRNKDDSPDRRLKEVREEADDDQFSDDELQDFLARALDGDDKIMNRNGRVDIRTIEGRALKAAGMLDDDNYPIEQQGRGRSRTTSRSRSSR
jgi:hypothetical protein